MAEDYFRPPIVALELPSRRASVWRFRIGLLLVLAAIAAGAVLGVRAILGSGPNGNAQGARHVHLVTTQAM
jgi:hypothetical protein